MKIILSLIIGFALGIFADRAYQKFKFWPLIK